MIKNTIEKLILNEELNDEELNKAFDDIITNHITPAQFGAFVTLIRVRGETGRELSILSQIVKKYAKPCFICEEGIDIVGTGGDCLETFNISTAAGLLAAAMGLKVVKV
jgi:anthranilate phosphoribosyltransferase